MCSWERKRSVPAGAGGDAQLTTSILHPSNLVRVLRTYSPRAGAESPLHFPPLTQIVSNSKFLSGPCKVIQLHPRGFWLSPTPLGDAPVSKGTLEHSCRQNGLVCAVLMMYLYQFLYRRRSRNQKGRGERHLRRRHLPSQRLHLLPRFVQCRSAGGRRSQTEPAPPSHPRQPRPGLHRVMGQVRATRPRAVGPEVRGCGGPSISRSLASAPLLSPPLLSPPCPKRSVEARAPERTPGGAGAEGSPYSKGSTWLGLYECTVVQCVRHTLPGLRFRSSLGSTPPSMLSPTQETGSSGHPPLNKWWDNEHPLPKKWGTGS